MNLPQTGSVDLYLEILSQIIGPTEELSFLDLCCGEMTATKRMSFASSLHIDVIDCPLRPPDAKFFHGDVLAELANIGENWFDVSLCSDGIEHLTKEAGHTLLLEMQRVSTLSIIFTPLGDMLVDTEATDPHTHKSGWIPSDPAFRFWQTKTFPNWHPTLNHGAFFAWHRKHSA